MTYVKRANVVLEVKEESIQHYLDLGYDVLDEQGNVVMKAIPSDLGELRKFYVDGNARIKELEAECEEVKAELERLKAKLKPGRKPQQK